MTSFVFWFQFYIKNETIAYNINEELSKISDWSAVNKLSLNISTQKFIHFYHQQEIMIENDYLKLSIKNSDIERIEEFYFVF